jgi:pyruvate/2-oxoglutarate dehydrogenase complex dihydrolipoamide acyltransferase (E2) component
MPNLESEGCLPEVAVRMVRFLVKPKTWINVDTPIALVGCGKVSYEILANGEGILREFLRKEGSALTFGENIGIVDADGESIPYGKPYSIAKKV